jgi:hypothetical protein
MGQRDGDVDPKLQAPALFNKRGSFFVDSFKAK